VQYKFAAAPGLFLAEELSKGKGPVPLPTVKEEIATTRQDGRRGQREEEAMEG